jgi:hypothetical protein
MIRLNLLVEGQTEETFVQELLVPHYARLNIFITPIIVRTSPGHKGGISTYERIKHQVILLCKEDSQAYVSTLFDLYGLPEKFPGKDHTKWSSFTNGHDKATFLEHHWAKDIHCTTFIPNLLVHEFEALLFVNTDKFNDWADSPKVASQLKEVAQSFDSPEEINNSRQTAPSKRILKVMPEFHKTIHGPLIACDIGLDAIRQSCTHFNNWLKKIENLAP